MVAKRNPGWNGTLFTKKGRAPLGAIYYFMIVWSACVVAFFRHHVNVTPDVVLEPWINMEAIPLLLISVGLMFLVVFPTQTTYLKWNQARTAWSQVNASCRALALQSCVYPQSSSLPLGGTSGPERPGRRQLGLPAIPRSRARAARAAPGGGGSPSPRTS
ncbi:unnamed protein product [Prorocentrum cordatum]|uniref:Protein S-acyltransferase n=1 Tax=Prorocentrum cordatum TaxID=2364126 RepID=A0ABN9S3J0_9DINO|nr:unnamed protein product [Polarella glacialis]